ncbi:Ubiquitin [Pleurostoma richardsiae]|uniref:Ubiquitin n=1 Tax=Pleurostoma richardsiae TaxID=41990 RepID=A0AA38RI47_9PEZI|nr:Ubiquitin [Pleurostoma richardsiae]
MAAPEPTMSGGQGEAPEQPKEAVEMTAIDSKAEGTSAAEVSKKNNIETSIPGVPAKDDLPPPAVAAEASPSSDDPSPAVPVEKTTTTEQPLSKGKEKDASATEEATVAAPSKDRHDSLSIGPSDAPHDGAAAHHHHHHHEQAEPVGPVCNITLLLPTGARHPYRLDERYLAKRNVEVPDLAEDGHKDPFSISVYKLKELILREWRDEWEGKPASPSSIRLIHFGKLLEDKEQLKKYQFSAESPNVVHMSVRPAEMLEEDEAAKGKSSSRDGRSGEGGSGCCVIL